MHYLVRFETEQLAMEEVEAAVVRCFEREFGRAAMER